MKFKRSFLTVFLIFLVAFVSIKTNSVSAMPFYGLNPKPMELRASFTTDYSKSSAERKHNIELASKKLNKSFIDIGGEFSFNYRVGVRNEQNGFKKAKIIKEGEFIEGVGGGVCQVSTTLYNAFLLADLKIIEYHPHSLEVSYVEPSFDAMVSYGYADLRVQNTTLNPVIIYCLCNGEKITVEIWGEKMNYKVVRKSVILGEIEIEEIDVSDKYSEELKGLKEGEKKILSFGKKGKLSEGYLIKIKNGKKEEIKLRKDKYLPIKRLFVLGKSRQENQIFKNN